MTLQKVIQQKQAIVAANGSVTLTFDPAPLGYVLTGTITITNAPVGSQWTLYNNGQPVDIANSSLSIGNVQAGANEIITLVSSGIQAGTTILGTWVAVLESTDTAALIVPQHDSVQPLSGYAKLIFTGQITADGTPHQLPNNPYTILPTTRSLVVVIYSPQGAVGVQGFFTVTGVMSGINWAAFASPGLQDIVGIGAAYPLPCAIALPCYGVVDSVIKISVTANNGGLPVGVVIGETPDEVALGGPQQPTASVDPLGPFTGARQTIATAGASGTLVAAPPSGFMTEIKEASVWQQGVATATAQNVIFDSSSNASYAGGFFQTGLVGMSHVTYNDMYTLFAINFTGNTSGVTVVYDIFTRTVPIQQVVP